jgi:hypothetical protein
LLDQIHAHTVERSHDGCSLLYASFGQLAAAIVALATAVAFSRPFSATLTIPDCTGQCQLAANRSWRVAIGFGILPAIFALCYRLTISETPRFTFDVSLYVKVKKTNADIGIFLGGRWHSSKSMPSNETPPIASVSNTKSGPKWPPSHLSREPDPRLRQRNARISP